MTRHKYYHIQHPTLTTKSERRTYTNVNSLTKDSHSKPNEKLIPKQVDIQLPLLKKQHHLFLPIFYFKLQNRTKQKA